MPLSRTRRITLVCFVNAKASTSFSLGRCRLRSAWLTEPGLLWGHLWAAPGAFSGMSEREGLTRTHHRTTPDLGPQEWGGRSQSTARMHSRDNWMKKTRKSCYLLGTERGQQESLHFLMLTVWPRYRHLSERLAPPDFQLSRITCSGQSRGEKCEAVLAALGWSRWNCWFVLHVQRCRYCGTAEPHHLSEL